MYVDLSFSHEYAEPSCTDKANFRTLFMFICKEARYARHPGTAQRASTRVLKTLVLFFREGWLLRGTNLRRSGGCGPTLLAATGYVSGPQTPAGCPVPATNCGVAAAGVHFRAATAARAFDGAAAAP